MHELSIASSLIDAASGEAMRQGAVLVRALHVGVGQLAVQDTPIAGASLVLEEVLEEIEGILQDEAEPRRESPACAILNIADRLPEQH